VSLGGVVTLTVWAEVLCHYVEQLFQIEWFRKAGDIVCYQLVGGTWISSHCDSRHIGNSTATQFSQEVDAYTYGRHIDEEKIGLMCPNRRPCSFDVMCSASGVACLTQDVGDKRQRRAVTVHNQNITRVQHN
jgi:hypothetical protein